MKKNSLTEQYVLLFDRLPPLLETMDYEDRFYQNLMFDAIMNNKPITEEDIEKELERSKLVYDTAEKMPGNQAFSQFKKPN